MRIGVITPTTQQYAGEVRQIADGGFELLHVIVLDGSGQPGAGCVGPLINTNMVRHSFQLPSSASDAGATPRSIGAAYALGQGCDVIAFLDDGNAYEPQHLANAVNLIQQGAEVVTSLRRFVKPDGTRMYVDVADSDGVKFADTNVIVLAGKAAKFATTFSWFATPSGTDRTFWERVKRSFGDQIVCTGHPTVLYETRWAAHFNATANHFRDQSGNVPDFSGVKETPNDCDAIWQPPNPAKFVRTGADGQRIAKLGEPVWNGRHWVAKGDGMP